MTLPSAFAVCLLSAVIPVVNAEAYVAAVAALADGTNIWLFSLAAGLGQTCGKIAFYQTGRTSRSWRWTQRKGTSEKWQTRLQVWQSRIENSRWTATGVIAASAFFGIPPLAVISVIAGRIRFMFPLFVSVVLIGRTLRFAAVFAGIDAINLL